tara:strand:+ start:200 stop:415 length:216 start_codon:yes stop_codon:yes gene_type:complete
MIAPLNLDKYKKLEDKYRQLSSFIRCIYNYTETNDDYSYDILRAEMNALSKKTEEIILELDAFEQNELGYK